MPAGFRLCLSVCFFFKKKNPVVCKQKILPSYRHDAVNLWGCEIRTVCHCPNTDSKPGIPAISEVALGKLLCISVVTARCLRSIICSRWDMIAITAAAASERLVWRITLESSSGLLVGFFFNLEHTQIYKHADIQCMSHTCWKGLICSTLQLM